VLRKGFKGSGGCPVVSGAFVDWKHAGGFLVVMQMFIMFRFCERQVACSPLGPLLLSCLSGVLKSVVF
jgi:hypothetical protein